MTSEKNLSPQELDRAAYEAAKTDDTASLLRHAAQKSGRSALKIGPEFARMANSDRKINMVEFVRWKLYDPDRYTDVEREQFISNDLHWPIIHKCCDYTWNAAAEDKFLADTILAAGGTPVPTAVAVIDRSARVFPNLRKIGTADALRDLLTGETGYDLFGKITGGMVSFGAFSVIEADKTHITCAGHEPMTYNAFMADFVGDNSYLIQRKLYNHADLAPFCSSIATVRMVNLVKDGGVTTPIAIIKVPQGDNIADAFWRDGNLACEVDVETGKVLTVVRRNGPDMDFLDDHPAVAGFMGFALPHWDKLREINEKAALIFAPLRYNSTDIAITPDGPVVVELNYGGGFDLPQNASGRGLLTPEVRAFFEECGYDFSAASKKKKRFRLFGKG